jgi:hypothetical protein
VHGWPGGLRFISNKVNLESIRTVKGRSHRGCDLNSIAAVIELGARIR